MNNIENSYVIQYKDKELKAHSLRKEEVDLISDFFYNVSFNKNNYKRLLGIGCDSDFKKKGALIESSKEEIAYAADHPDEFMSMGIWNSDGIPEAFMITQIEDLDDLVSDKNNFSFQDNYESLWEEWIECKNNHTLIYKGDMAVNTKSYYRKLYFLMYYLFIQNALEQGYKKILTEIFCITDYYDGSNWHRLDISNERSFKAQIRGTKARYVADGKTKEKILFDDVKIKYYPKYLEYDLHKTFESTKEAIKSLNLTIKMI